MPVARPPAQLPWPTPAELWFFNGTPLQDAFGAWNIATMGGSRFSLPVLRGQNVAAPYRAGQSWQAKYPDARTITLTMWVSGQGFGSLVNNGSYPAADQRLAWNSNWQSLRQMFWVRGQVGSTQSQLTRNWYFYQNGTPTLVASSAMCEIAGSVDLTMNGRTNAAFSVDLLLSDPYFYGSLQTVAVGTNTNVTGLGEGTAGEGFPSAVSQFTVTCSAPCTVTNSTAGISFTLTSGPAYPVTVDILNQTVTDAGGANQIQYFSHAGSRMWMSVFPGVNACACTSGTATFRFNDAYV